MGAAAARILGWRAKLCRCTEVSYPPSRGSVLTSARWRCHGDTRLGSEGAQASCNLLSLGFPHKMEQ